MRSVKLGNGLLWLVNVALIAGIVVFAVQYLIFPENANPLEDVEQAGSSEKKPAPPRPPDYSPLKNLPNPVVPYLAGPKDPIKEITADLLGTVTSEQPVDMVAYLLVTGRNLYVNAYFNEPVLQDGSPVSELVGWKLVKVSRDTATFSNGQKETTLNVKGNPTSGGGPTPGGAFDKSKIKFQKLAAANDRETYGIDKQSAEWMMDHQDELLADVGMQDYASGGIQIVKLDAASPAGQVGLQAYDVVKTINGQTVQNALSLNDLRNSEPLKRANSLVVTIERAGTTKTIVIQPTTK